MHRPGHCIVADGISYDSTGQPSPFKVKMTADSRQLRVISWNSGCVKVFPASISERQRAGNVFGLGQIGLNSGAGKKDICSNPGSAWRRLGFFIIAPDSVVRLSQRATLNDRSVTWLDASNNMRPSDSNACVSIEL